MKHNYSTSNFTPSNSVLDVIRQFAYTYRTLTVGGQRMALYLN